MADNPFLKPEAAEAAPEEVAETSVAESEGQPGGDVTEEDDSSVSALLADLEEAEPVEEPAEEPALSLVEDEPDDGMPPKPEGNHWVPGKRYNAKNKELKATKEELELLKVELEQVSDLGQVAAEMYQGVQDPIDIMKFDASFMNALETLSKENPQIAQFAQDVKKFMETGETPAKQEVQPPPRRQKVEEERPAEDPKIAKLLEREARRSVTQVLTEAQVPKDRHTSIWRYILHESGVDIGDLDDPQEVIRLTRDWAKADGVNLAELVGAKPKGDKKSTPPTGAKRSGTTESRAATEEADEEPKSKAPKNLDEWRANREREFRGIGNIFE